VELKRFSAQDGLGIHLLRFTGVKIAIITGRESESVRIRAADLKVDDLIQDRRARKVPAMQSLLDKYGIPAADAAYMGDDISDLGVLRMVGLPVAPANAAQDVKEIAQVHLTRDGGYGAVREFVEMLLRARGEWDSGVERYLAERAEPDSNPGT